MVKNYTNIEQSKKLIKILPLESADMYWAMETIPYLCLPLIDGTTDWDYAQENNLIPAWSLAALLEVLPKICYPVKQDYPTYLTLGKPKDKWCALYWDATGIQDGEQTLADNPVDACVEMIIKLHDQKLL